MTTHRPIGDIVEELTLRDGTVSTAVGVPVPTTGYVVAVARFNRQYHWPSAWAAWSDVVRDWVTSVLTVSLQPNRYLGSWHDDELWISHLDVVEIFAERDAAEKAGRDRGEIAIWDLTHGAEIRLQGPTGRCTKCDGSVGFHKVSCS